MTNDKSNNDRSFTRLRLNFQLGDGPDQRGDMTVEVSREVDPDAERKTDEVQIPLDDGQTRTVAAPTNDEVFAEFYNEVSRSERVLREVLGLEDE